MLRENHKGCTQTAIQAEPQSFSRKYQPELRKVPCWQERLCEERFRHPAREQNTIKFNDPQALRELPVSLQHVIISKRPSTTKTREATATSGTVPMENPNDNYASRKFVMIGSVTKFVTVGNLWLRPSFRMQHQYTINMVAV